VGRSSKDGCNIENECKISRKKQGGWTDYSNQPVKYGFYIGVLLFVPKVERTDFSIYNSQITVPVSKRIISDKIRNYASSILNCQYKEIAFQSITDGEKNKEVGLVQKYNNVYSENHMGFGEGRLLYFIDMLENKPDKSLFIIEEPEISLHEDAQYKFVKYLMDVCNRKHHQIILTTHSSIIINALPPEGRKLILRDVYQEVKVLDRVSGNRVKSILSDGNSKTLTICVEDEFASLKLKEAIRQIKPELLPLLNISFIGDKEVVANTVKLLNDKMDINAIGIRDADVGEDKMNRLFKLPGSLPPEKEVYENRMVQEGLYKEYNIHIPTILSGVGVVDHHTYGKIFSEKACCSVEAMNISAIKLYLNIQGLDGFKALINIIEHEM